MSSRRRSASAGSRARRRRTAEGLRRCPRFWRDDFIDIDALREALDVVRTHSASFSLGDRNAWTPSFLPDQFEMGPDQADGTITERWELQNKGELQKS